MMITHIRIFLDYLLTSIYDTWLLCYILFGFAYFYEIIIILFLVYYITVYYTFFKKRYRKFPKPKKGIPDGIAEYFREQEKLKELNKEQ